MPGDQRLIPPEYPDGYESLTGTEERRLDEAGRLALPAGAFRTTFQEHGAHLAPWRGCLGLFTHRSFNARVATFEVRRLDGDTRITPEFIAAVRESAVMVTPDGQGRIPLPEHYRRAVGLEAGEVVLISGQGDHLELWNPERHRSRRGRLDLFAQYADDSFADLL